jgi:hypothetical protein
LLKPAADLDEARAEFDRCWPWLRKSLSEFCATTHTKEQVWRRIEHHQAFLWTVPQGVIVGEFYHFPSGTNTFNYWLQGGHLPACKSMHEGIEAWAAEREPLDFFVGLGRRGWVREMHGDWKEGPTLRWKRASS